MAAEEPMAASKKPSMEPPDYDAAKAKAPPAVAVPVGAAPIVPAFVPPARQYDDEDDPDDPDDPAKAQQRLMLNPPDVQGPSLTLIFSVALVLITLAAVASFYALQAVRNSETEPPTVATTTSTAHEEANNTVQSDNPLDAAEIEASSVADLEDELETIPPVDTT